MTEGTSTSQMVDTEAAQWKEEVADPGFRLRTVGQLDLVSVHH